MPYNGALFCVSDHYSEVFDEDVFKKRDYKLGEETYKIKYELNILPFIGMHIDSDGQKVNSSISLMNIICDSDELNLFNCDVIQDLIYFKWSRFGKRWHLIGCFFHFFYMFILMYYI